MDGEIEAVMGYVGAPGCERWAYSVGDEADEPGAPRCDRKVNADRVLFGRKHRLKCCQTEPRH